MADNVVANTGSGGATFRTDDVGGVQFPYSKIDAGGDGVSVPIVAGQQLKAASLPVVLASDQGALPITDNAGSLTVDGTVAISGTVAVTDNSGSLTVDSTQLPAALGQTTMANSLPVALASNQSALPITDNSGSLTVDAPVGTPAFVRLSDGSAAITALPITDNSGSLTVDSTQFPASLGQKAMAASYAVVIASDQSAVPASQSGTWNIGTVTPGTAATNLGKAEDVAHTTGDTGVFMLAVRNDSVASLSDTTGDYSPLQVNANGSLRVVVEASGVQIAPGSGSDANALRVSASNANAVARDAVVSTNPVTVGGRASTAVPGAVSADGDSVDVWLDRNGATVQATRPCTSGGAANVASSATNVTLLASNTARRGFTIWNDSTQILFVKMGATASATSYHFQMIAGAYYESPAGFLYTGIIDGIWASANGNARVGEFT